ncbi:MAG TPA: SGNH/GDSL hydrolase family protein [Nocardioidaceae bacterium]|nr:SGNH/GDSL hydrolase family protein [Nocardioidaceae bacterium]
MSRRLLTRSMVAVVTAALAVPPLVSASNLATADDGGTLPASAKVYTEYVALGDSYSAGPLIPQQRPDLLGCLRSTNNYPAFLATYFSLVTYSDVTCSGAETSDMRQRQNTIVPGPSPAPQLDALTESTDLVTLGIGGNDYGLFGSMISKCEEVRPQDPDGAPCKRYYTVDGVDTKKRDARRIQPRVGRVVREIRARSPKADVFVFGYPRLLPARGTCPEVPFAAGDYTWGNQIERILNRSLRRAAENNGATYIDLYPASAGHHACAGKKAWINGSEIKPTEAANFHPYLKGMRGVSRAAYRQIAGETAPKVQYASRFADPVVPPLDEAQLSHLAALLEEYLGAGLRG